MTLHGRVALVLGAGGLAGGAFHAGVLAALEEATGWDPRRASLIVGTSAGSLTGAFLRAGLAAPDLAARARGLPLSAEGERLLSRLGRPAPPELSFAGFGPSPGSMSTLVWAGLRPWKVRAGSVVASLMPEGKTPSEPIRELVDLACQTWPRERLWVNAVRTTDARRVVFGRESTSASVGQAVAASCAIPGVFAPVAIDGDRYVDGGSWSPTNLDVVRREKLDLVIVSSPMSTAHRGFSFRADQPFRRFCRGLLARETAATRRRGLAVLSLQPTLEDQKAMGLNPMDPNCRAPTVVQVHESTLARLERRRVRALLG